MGKLLDQQVSQNASTSGAISIPVSTTPQLFGTLGLHTAGAGSNLRVEYTFTAAFSSLASLLTPINISIYRGTGADRVLVFSATQTLPVAGLGVASNTVISLSGADFNPPSPNNFLIYQAFISTTGGLSILPRRIGPETFSASSYSD